MDKKWVLPLVVIVTVFISGCTQSQNTVTFFVCSDGTTTVENLDDCPTKTTTSVPMTPITTITTTTTVPTLTTTLTPECTPNWQCSECTKFGKQTRTCTNISNCGASSGIPDVSQTCIYILREPEPIIISGSGQQASGYFELEQGLSIFELNHNGNGHFAMVLYRNDGDYISLLVNEIGSFDGSRAVSLSTSGNYLLDVSADGSWQVSIE